MFHVRIPIFLLISALALGLGFSTRQLLQPRPGAPDNPPGTPSDPAPAGTVSAEQVSNQPGVNPVSDQTRLLFIQYDRESSAAPSLLGAWLLARHPASPYEAIWVPLFPALSEADNASLAAAFTLDENGRAAGEFLQALGDLYRLDWDASISLDSQAAVQVIDALGGIALDGGLIESSQVVQPAASDPAAQIHNQARIIRAACQQLSGPQAGSKAAALARLLASRLEPTQAASLKVTEGMIFPWIECRFPTLETQVTGY